MVSDTRTMIASGTPLPVLLIALFTAALGAAAIAIVGSNISSIVAIAEQGEAFGTTLLRFLNAYGIVVPILLIAAGIYLLRLAVQVFRMELIGATWVRQWLLWLIIALAVLALQAFSTGLSRAVDSSDALGRGVLFVIIALAAGGAYWWLGLNMHVFVGMETLEATSSRTAWNLLIPTVIILMLVALRPLEATFIYSMTDRRFAAGAGAQVNFVGLDNYAQLLGVRFDVVGCTRDDAGACQTNASGALVFPRLRDVLDESYRTLRYRDLSVINIGESQFIISARDRDFFSAIGNTLTFTFFSVLLELILGLFVAMVINSKFAGRGLLRAAMLVPWAIPTVISAKLWEVMLRDNLSGVINSFFVSTGLLQAPQAWLVNASLQIPALIAVDVWKTTPFMALILLAGLQTIPSDIYEAADVDGAGRIRQFFSLTLPMLRPTIAVALVFRTLDAVRVFDVFQVLLGRQQLSMATYNYETLVNSQQLGYASTIGVLIFIIILIFTVTYVRILGVNAE